MAQKEKFASAAASQSSEPFELVSFEDSRKVNHASPTVTETEIRRHDEVEFPWIDPEMLRLKHRIGRGPFGDLWIATHHVSTSDYDEYHEVAVKMLPPVKDDRHIQAILARFHQAFKNIQGLPHVCFLYGVTVKNGKNVSFIILLIKLLLPICQAIITKCLFQIQTFNGLTFRNFHIICTTSWTSFWVF